MDAVISIALNVAASYTYDWLKSLSSKIDQMPWDELYIDAHIRATEILTHYERDKNKQAPLIIGAERQALYSGLHQEMKLGTYGADELTLSRITSASFFVSWCGAITKHTAIVAGGLEGEDYLQQVRNVVRHANSLYAVAITSSAVAYRRMNLLEDLATRAALHNLSRELRQRFEQLDSIALITEQNAQVLALLQTVTGVAAPEDFSLLIEEAVRGFQGRQFVFDAVDSFMRSQRCGYFRIIADAGLGKTAIAAQLVKRYNALPYFFDARLGITGSARCLNHLAAQLIIRYGLSERYPRVPEHAGETGTFLQRLLVEVAEKIASQVSIKDVPAGAAVAAVAVAETAGEVTFRAPVDVPANPPREKDPGVAAIGMHATIQPPPPIVIVIDALDEADSPGATHSWLHLPVSLPEGVYFILTHRPGEYPVYTDPRVGRDEFTILWDDPHQQKDIKAFLRAQAGRPEIARVLHSAPASTNVEEFITKLQAASEGNFMYLRYMLEDIATLQPGNNPLNLSALPRGLEGYYARFWSHIGVSSTGSREEWKAWDELYRPTIGLLGSAGEAVTAEWLGNHVGGSAHEVRERALARWQRFLRHERVADRETWQIVHQTFADFLSRKLGMQEFHRRIARYYLGDATRWPLHDGYAYRQLSNQLLRAGSPDDYKALFELVDNTEWYSSQTAEDPSGLLYLNDVMHAWTVAEGINSEAIAKGGRALYLTREAKCALTVATFRSLAYKTPPRVLLGLVQSGFWTPQQALASLQQNTEGAAKEYGLKLLIPHLLGPLDTDGSVVNADDTLLKDTPDAKVFYSADLDTICNQALEIASSITFPLAHCRAMFALASYLPAGQRIQVQRSTIDKIRSRTERGDWEQWAYVVAGAATHLSDPLLDSAIEALGPPPDITLTRRSHIQLQALMPYLPKRAWPDIFWVLLHPLERHHSSNTRGVTQSQVMVADPAELIPQSRPPEEEWESLLHDALHPLPLSSIL